MVFKEASILVFQLTTCCLLLSLQLRAVLASEAPYPDYPERSDIHLSPPPDLPSKGDPVDRPKASKSDKWPSFDTLLRELMPSAPGRDKSSPRR